MFIFFFFFPTMLICFLRMKPRVPAFTVPQLSEAMDVLNKRAEELMVTSLSMR